MLFRCSRTFLQRGPGLLSSRVAAFQNQYTIGGVQSAIRSKSVSAGEKPFRILGVQQIAIGAEDRGPLRALWQGVFGLEVQSSHRLEKENVEEDIVRVGPTANDELASLYGVEIDLMCPIDPDKSPKVHKPPLNHIGLWVDDIHKAVEWMGENGVRFTPGGIRRGAAGHDVTFIHPKGNEAAPLCGNGVLIELVQAPDDVIDAFTKGSPK